ncbi:MAG: phosphatase PAP2 family protein [Bacteroidota bacterium]
MNLYQYFRLSILVLLLGSNHPTFSQKPLIIQPVNEDTLKQVKPGVKAQTDTTRKWYKGKLLRASVVPVVLIGYGISTINNHGFYSSYSAKTDVRHLFVDYRNHIDNYLQFAPFLELGIIKLLKVETENDGINLLLLIAKAELLDNATVQITKRLTNITRPDGGQYSFPSGHTAQAFMAATIVYKETRNRSPWYGIGAYTMAAGVAGLRMVNNRHWESDVFAGAGVGILSAQVAYLTHRHRWGRKSISFYPVMQGGAKGIGLVWNGWR